MNTRKFYLFITIVVSIFLFISGTFILSSLNVYSETETSSPLEDILNPFKGTKDPLNVLVLVGDASSGNTDTMLLLNFNPTTAQINLLSIPRDTKVTLKGRTAKINASYATGGAEMAVDTVGSLLDVNINYYVYVSISAFKGIIDKLGGVDFYIPVDMNYDDPIQGLSIHLKKGQQHLDGDKAEQFLRFRHPNGKITKEMAKYYDGSDLKREDMQQKFIKELIRQKANVFYITRINEIMTYIFKNVKTNMELDDALKMCQNISKLGSNELKSFKISGTSENGGAWYYIYNDEILDVSVGEAFPAEDILSEYFNASGEFINKENPDYEPTPVKSTTKSSTTKKSSTPKKSTAKNPSNSDTDLKGTDKPQP